MVVRSEVRIENSVTKVTVIPSDGIFNLHRTAIKDSFSCRPVTAAFRIEYVLFINYM